MVVVAVERELSSAVSGGKLMMDEKFLELEASCPVAHSRRCV